MKKYQLVIEKILSQTNELSCLTEEKARRYSADPTPENYNEWQTVYFGWQSVHESLLEACSLTGQNLPAILPPYQPDPSWRAW